MHLTIGVFPSTKYRGQIPCSLISSVSPLQCAASPSTKPFDTEGTVIGLSPLPSGAFPSTNGGSIARRAGGSVPYHAGHSSLRCGTLCTRRTRCFSSLQCGAFLVTEWLREEGGKCRFSPLQCGSFLATPVPARKGWARRFSPLQCGAFLVTEFGCWSCKLDCFSPLQCGAFLVTSRQRIQCESKFQSPSMRGIPRYKMRLWLGKSAVSVPFNAGHSSLPEFENVSIELNFSPLQCGAFLVTSIYYRRTGRYVSVPFNAGHSSLPQTTLAVAMHGVSVPFNAGHSSLPESL